MKIIIKCLKGDSITTDVTSDTLILEVKKTVEQQLKIPLAHQSLIMLGKSLQDHKRISDYPTIKEGSKLHIVVRKIESFEEILGKVLRKFYTEEQCRIIVNQFMKEFDKTVKNLTLDDIERIATASLNEGK